MSAVEIAKFLFLHLNKKKNGVIIGALVNGLCMSALMYSLQIGINDIALGDGVSIRGFLLFVCAWAAYYITQLLVSKTVSGAACTAVEDIELRLIDKLRRIDYPAFRTISSADIYAALGGDKNTVMNAARLMVSAFSGGITVAIAFVYMANISVASVLLILLLFAVLILVYRIQNGGIARRTEIDSHAVGDYMTSLEDLVNGFAELKMNNLKSEDFYNRRLKPASNRKTESFIQTGIHWVQMLIINQTGLFIALGLIVFIAPVISDLGLQNMIVIVSITLMIIGPAGSVIGFIGASDLANNTLSKIWLIEKRLDEEASGDNGEDLSAPPETPDFSVLKIDRLMYTYPETDNGFTLRVGDFCLNKGELVIIKGGNGSGKSTFLHLLAGLLLPREGEILVDGKAASSLKSADYRSLFSIVFSGFRLFDDFYGFEADKTELDYWVKKLGLEEQFKQYDRNNKLPVKSLSSGQRKRMALLSVILENKKVLLLDEVAADFDPEFRAKYYREIIPELKAAGRTLLLVSHDDRYFDIADRVIEFREGTNIA